MWINAPRACAGIFALGDLEHDVRLGDTGNVWPSALAGLCGRRGGHFLSDWPILRRIGFSPLWSVLVFVPLLNVLGVCFWRWPIDRCNQTRSNEVK